MDEPQSATLVAGRNPSLLQEWQIRAFRAAKVPNILAGGAIRNAALDQRGADTLSPWNASN
ncbi:hypothetical protein [Ruegeria atlantica]|uniref:hypothetical protein n=1 Tax=Ruegeria atlantica TaxID=81569 RepID=UPI00249576A7|nr:hypothetical protein [Ruegeria atlantica]